MKRFALLILMLLAFAVAANAQDKAKIEARLPAAFSGQAAVVSEKTTASIALTDAESKDAIAVLNTINSLERELQGRWVDILNAPIEKSIEVVSKAQLTLKNLQLAQVAGERLIERHRLAHGCPDYVYGEDGKTLVKPRPKGTIAQ